MTANEIILGSWTLVVAFAVGGVFAWYTSRRGLPRVASVVLAPLVAAVLLALLWFTLCAVQVFLHGTPNGANPVLYALASALLFAPGLALLGGFPAVFGAVLGVWVARGWPAPDKGRPDRSAADEGDAVRGRSVGAERQY